MTEVIVEHISEDLEVLIPSFMDNTYAEIALLEGAVEAEDLKTVHRLGHNIKGSALNYGFNKLSEIGRKIEIAAGSGDLGRVLSLLEELRMYVKRVEISFV